MEHIVVKRLSDSFFAYQGWPTVCTDDNGNVYVVASGFRMGHVCPFGKTVMYKSTDNCKSFSLPQIVNDTYLDDRDAGIVHTGGNNFLVTWFSHPADVYQNDFHKWIKSDAGEGGAGFLAAFSDIPDELRHGGSFITFSEDGCNSFSGKVQVPVSAPHGPVMLRDGTLIYLGSEMYSGSMPVPENKDAIVCYKSTDKGHNWVRLGECPVPDGLYSRNFCEPHCIELNDGRLMGFLRAEGKEIGENFTMYKTFSDDGGLTWAMPECVGISGSPPFLFRHSSGKIVLVYTRRQMPYSIRAVLMNDNGEFISDEFVLDDNSDSADMGYPATAELKDGRLVTVYYIHHRNPDGSFDKHCSILGTIWNIDEIKLKNI